MTYGTSETQHPQGRIRPLLLGGGLFIVSAPLHLVVARDVSVAIAAITLALIGGAYIGFAARSASQKVFWGELLVAVGFGLAALAGLFWSPLAIGIGLILHAGWDLLHHRPGFGAGVPGWYIPFCVAFDVIAGVFLVALYTIR